MSTHTNPTNDSTFNDQPANQPAVLTQIDSSPPINDIQDGTNRARQNDVNVADTSDLAANLDAVPKQPDASPPA